ncbi:agamous-like MADS-box protein AGL86 [Salvia splendens]|uniref:agamous-like MADS-box protein AGL86 n=1 Tax=Salvia splendens TaxID=180675 RepID=UPI001C25A413|nr:agamous-like MADS-box protein AGL86 [Salvia splendens]
MGRRRLKLESIEKQKSRLLTLNTRKEGLKKKLHQLTTLCDVPACMIIRDPSTNSTSIWPEDSAQVRRLIDSYKADPGAVKTYRVSDFFNERQRNAEGELAKLQKKNLETELRTWDGRLHLMDEPQLREIGAAVRSEALAVQSRIDFLKREAMVKSNEMLDLGEFGEIVDQDVIFSIADGVAGISADAQLPVVPDYSLNLPQPLMKKSTNNVMLDLDKFGGVVGQDGGYSIADVMDFAMRANAPLNMPQDGIFSVADVMGDNGQLPLPGYYCPPPLEMFVDHNYLNQGYCSSMDVNQNVDWFGGDEYDGGDLVT